MGWAGFHLSWLNLLIHPCIHHAQHLPSAQSHHPGEAPPCPACIWDEWEGLIILVLNNLVKAAPGNHTRVHLHLSMPLKFGFWSFLTVLAHGIFSANSRGCSAHQSQPYPTAHHLSQTLQTLHSGGTGQQPSPPAARDFGQQVTQTPHIWHYK